MHKISNEVLEAGPVRGNLGHPHLEVVVLELQLKLAPTTTLVLLESKDSIIQTKLMKRCIISENSLNKCFRITVPELL